MRKSLIVGLVAGLMAPMALIATPASADNIGDEGCTPGYWKNHTDNWEDLPGVPINPKKKTLAKADFETAYSSGDDLLLDALRYRGGRGLAGAERILLRAATAAWLNAAHEGLGYPLRRANFVPVVNKAIASGDRGTMISLASELDWYNNLGCPLN